LGANKGIKNKECSDLDILNEGIDWRSQSIFNISYQTMNYLKIFVLKRSIFNTRSMEKATF